MNIKSIKLNAFRNFKKEEISLSEKITIIVGPNASGKTNILESVYLLATGKSFRAKVEEEMVNHNVEIARVIGEVIQPKDNPQKTKLEVVLTRGEITIGEDPRKIQRVPRKKLLVNGVSRRLIDFSGNFKVVLFAPKDLDLVTESPSLRRAFLDGVLAQVDREYRRAALSYEKGLRQRNRLLQRIRDEGLSRSQLLFWDKLLIKNGNYITDKRRELIAFINSNISLSTDNYSLVYDDSTISENRLEEYAQEEVYAATTLVGPHRDDFVFMIASAQKGNTKFQARDLSRFGSRGEQRMGILWLKVAELEYIKEISGENPTLLLDDIFSELDHEHRDIVMDIAKKYQSLITTADPHYLGGFGKIQRIELK